MKAGTDFDDQFIIILNQKSPIIDIDTVFAEGLVGLNQKCPIVDSDTFSAGGTRQIIAFSVGRQAVMIGR